MGPFGQVTLNFIRIQFIILWAYWLVMKRMADRQAGLRLRSKSIARRNALRRT